MGVRRGLPALSPLGWAGGSRTPLVPLGGLAVWPLLVCRAIRERGAAVADAGELVGFPFLGGSRGRRSGAWPVHGVG